MTAQNTMDRTATTSRMAADGIAAVQQVAAESTAQVRGLMENGWKPAAEAFSKATSGATEFGRGNLEAVTQSTQAYLTGMQDLSRQYFAAMQGLTQHAVEGAKAFAGARSLKDAMAVQANLARASVELALGEGTKLQQAALKVTEQVYAPLTQRTTAALGQTKFARAA
ncbi:phasin family protein [Siccirubricoccus sp. G192]|uniref:phasin family protein n=1 Tax=Siccirubricoccus sp. G192 TaxID=2849651 RepID=UPI001C2B9200|nr:TIGR01841 family phasin [Siccirubricoccus sp. G192]MBV1796476.1 TIGR01841 family phasin [Siccirubricoccus sp. G192]